MNALRKPWYLSLIIYLIWEIVIMRVEYLPFIVHHRPLYQFEDKCIEFRKLVAIIFFPGAISYLKWWPQIGWKGLYNKRGRIFLGLKLQDLRFLWLPILFFLIQILSVLFTDLKPTQVLVYVVINTLMAGIREELMFRGILFHGPHHHSESGVQRGSHRLFSARDMH